MHDVAQEFEGVEVSVENFGESELADRFGVERYPAIFVDDVLIARPKDFGFYGETGSQGEGRYTPWLDVESHEKFRADLRLAVGAAHRGDYQGLQVHAVEADLGEHLSVLPEFEVQDLKGATLSSEDLHGRVVMVEFWATWCPPCVAALPWLSSLQSRYADDLTIVGFAIESPEADLRGLSSKHSLAFPVVAAGPEIARAFGDVLAVPTLFVFDRQGVLQRTAYGSPPELTGEIEALLAEWIGESEGSER